jgi:putative addiction module component (TIGR02574 family)
MIHSVEQLEAELLLLPVGERARLAERLIASLDEEAAIEEALSDEVQRRLADFDAGIAASFSAADVISEARGRLR